jgi:hypothetical protein
MDRMISMATFEERLSKLRTERTLSLATLAAKLRIEHSKLFGDEQDKRLLATKLVSHKFNK